MAEMTGIEFEIKASTDKARSGVNDLTKSLKTLQKTMSSGFEMKGFQNVTKAIEQLSKSVAKVDAKKFYAISSAARSLASLSTAMSSLGNASKTADAAISLISKVAQIDFSKISAAAEGLTGLASALRGLSALSKNTESLPAVAEHLRDIAQIDFSNIQNAAQGLTALASVSKMKLPTGEMTKMGGASNLLKVSLDGVVGALRKVGTMSLKAAVHMTTLPFKKAASGAKEFAGKLASVVNALKRIIFYRMIRTLVKQIGEAFKYGVNNLYAWSNAVGGTFAASMDRIATSFAYFKNSVGAAVAPLINALAPAIEYVIDKAVALLNIINQLFAKLSGATFWTKATKQATSYGGAVDDAAGSAKELAKYLAPFDELNVLPDNSDSGGGGGGGSSDASGLFEEQVGFDEGLNDIIEKFKSAWENADFTEIGNELASAIAGWLDNLPWEELKDKCAKVGKSIGTFITGFVNNDEAQTAFGRALAELINTVVSGIDGFVTSVDWDGIGTFIARNIDSFFETFDFSKAGITFNGLVQGILDAAIKATNVDWAGFGTKIGQFISKIKWGEVFGKVVSLAGNIFNGLLTALVNFAKTLNENGSWEELGRKIGEALRDLPWKEIFENVGDLGRNVLIGLRDCLAGAISGVFGTDNSVSKGIADAILAGALAIALADVIKKITGTGGLLNAFKKKDSSLQNQTKLTEAEVETVECLDTAFANLAITAGSLVTAYSAWKELLAGGVEADVNVAVNSTATAVSPSKAEVTSLREQFQNAYANALSNLTAKVGITVEATPEVTTDYSAYSDTVESVKNAAEKAYEGLTVNKSTSTSTNTSIAYEDIVEAVKSAAESVLKGNNTGTSTNSAYAGSGSTDEWGVYSSLKDLGYADNSTLGDVFSKLIAGELGVGLTGLGVSALLPGISSLPIFAGIGSTLTTGAFASESEPIAVDVTANFTKANWSSLTQEDLTGKTTAQFGNYKKTGDGYIDFLGETPVAKAETKFSYGKSSDGTANDLTGVGAKANTTFSYEKTTDGVAAGLGSVAAKAIAKLAFNKNSDGTASDLSSLNAKANAAISYPKSSDGTPTALSSLIAKATAKIGDTEFTKEVIAKNATSWFEYYAWKKNGSEYKPWSYANSWFNEYYWTDSTGRHAETPWSYATSKFNKTSWSETPWSWATAYIGWWKDSMSYYPRIDGYLNIVGTTQNQGQNSTQNAPAKMAEQPPAYNTTSTYGSKNIEKMVATGGAFFGGAWHSIAQYAKGTANALHGSLFLAGEAGPEIVGHVGGRTEVLNQSQLASTMYSSIVAGVAKAISSASLQVQGGAPYTYGDSTGATLNEDAMYRAFKRALDETDFEPEIQLDGETLYRSMVNRNRRNTRMTGANAMA